MAERYRVDKAGDQPECQCVNCVMWTIVCDSLGEAEVTEMGTSWRGGEGYDCAQDVCDLMNMAYACGREELGPRDGETILEWQERQPVETTGEQK